MTHDDLTSLYHAFNTRDIEAILVFMRPDVDWPNGQEGGWVYGHRGVRKYGFDNGKLSILRQRRLKTPL